MKKIINVTEENFDQAVSQGISIVDFWAPWCGPCLMQTPILESLAQNSDGSEFNIYKVNVDENQQIAAKYGVRSIPTIMIFNNGEIKNTYVGVQSEKALMDAIK